MAKEPYVVLHVDPFGNAEVIGPFETEAAADAFARSHEPANGRRGAALPLSPPAGPHMLIVGPATGVLN